MRGFWIVLSMSVAVSFMFGAEYDEKGMKLYKRLCASCHGSPDYGAGQLEQEEWEDLFFMHGHRLIEAHRKQPEVYAKLQKASKKRSFSHLANYLIGNAKDSGSVGGCDGNRCGITGGEVPMKASASR